MAPTSSSPPGIFTFDEPFGSMTQSFEYNIYPQDRQQTQPHSHAHHHKAHSGELPWKAQTQNSDPSRSIAFQILNSYYSRLDLPPFESELESFRQRYHRDSELVNRAIKLRDGKIQPHPEGGFSPAPRPDQAGSDNTTVFVGGLNPNIHADLIKAIFTPFGAIDYVKTPPTKGCGFVKYFVKADAEKAIEKMQGFEIDRHRLRLSWGRSGSGERSGGTVGTQSLQRLVHYVEPQLASRILTAIDEVFEGNMQAFREGLQYLVIANGATLGSSTPQGSNIGHPSLNVKAVPFSAPRSSQPESRSNSSGYIGPLDHSASWSDLQRYSSYSSDEQQTQADDNSLESFSPTFLGLDADFHPSTEADRIEQETYSRAFTSGKASPDRVDLRNVAPQPLFETPSSRSSSLSSNNAFGAIGGPPGGASCQPPSRPTAYDIAARFSNLSTSAEDQSLTTPYHMPSFTPAQATTRRISEPVGATNQRRPIVPTGPAYYGANWHSGMRPSSNAFAQSAMTAAR